jgi:hypothetical protein
MERNANTFIRNIKSIMLVGAMLGCGPKGGSDSSLADAGPTSLFSYLTATLTCTPVGGAALSPMTFQTVAAGVGVIGQMAVPKTLKDGLCSVAITGTPQPNFVKRIAWNATGPTANGLAYASGLTKVVEESPGKGSFVLKAKFTKTFADVCEQSKAAGKCSDPALRPMCDSVCGAAGNPSNPASANVAMVGGYTCEQQKAWNKCSEPWMHPVCSSVCGAAGTLNQVASANPAPANVAMVGGYRCEQQKAWNKCSEPWMHPVCDAVCGPLNQAPIAAPTPTVGNGNQTLAGCNYDDAAKNKGFGWNPTTNQSCPPR